MSPFEIHILLHYYARADDYDGHKPEPLYSDTMDGFILAGLLEEIMGDVHFKATDRLRAYCEALIDVPLPIQKWVMP